jgi:hypothetical protein
MLDRDDDEEFLDCKLKQARIKIPRDIKKEALVEAFCQYVEDDYKLPFQGSCVSYARHLNAGTGLRKMSEIQQREAILVG